MHIHIYYTHIYISYIYISAFRPNGWYGDKCSTYQQCWSLYSQDRMFATSFKHQGSKFQLQVQVFAGMQYQIFRLLYVIFWVEQTSNLYVQCEVNFSREYSQETISLRCKDMGKDPQHKKNPQKFYSLLFWGTFPLIFV